MGLSPYFWGITLIPGSFKDRQKATPEHFTSESHFEISSEDTSGWKNPCRLIVPKKPPSIANPLTSPQVM